MLLAFSRYFHQPCISDDECMSCPKTRDMSWNLAVPFGTEIKQDKPELCCFPVISGAVELRYALERWSQILFSSCHYQQILKLLYHTSLVEKNAKVGRFIKAFCRMITEFYKIASISYYFNIYNTILIFTYSRILFIIATVGTSV